jgi:hypothetical protein
MIMNKFVKAILAVIALASLCSSAYAFYLLPAETGKPADCKDGWCNVEQTVVTADGDLKQTTLKVWVGK